MNLRENQTAIENLIKEVEDKCKISLHLKIGWSSGHLSGWGYVGLLESNTDFGFSIYDEKKARFYNGFYGSKDIEINSLDEIKNEIIKDIKVSIQSAIDWSEGWGHKKSKYSKALVIINQNYND